VPGQALRGTPAWPVVVSTLDEVIPTRSAAPPRNSLHGGSDERAGDEFLYTSGQSGDTEGRDVHRKGCWAGMFTAPCLATETTVLNVNFSQLRPTSPGAAVGRWSRPS